MLDYIQNNYEWLFSGAGLTFVSWFIGYKQGYSKAIKQQMKVENNSTAIQVAGNMKGNIGNN